MNADQEISEVVRVIYNEWKLNAEDAPFFLSPEKLQHCPDHEAILEKLQSQYKVISIMQKPNAGNLSSADVYLAELEFDDSVTKKYLSYSIVVKPDFEKYYNHIIQRNPNGFVEPDLKDVKLTVDSYSTVKGLLHLTQYHNVQIAKRGKSKKSSKRKYFECWVLENLFKNPTRLKEGVNFHTLLNVNSTKTLDKTEIKKVRNARTAINNKVKEVNGPKGLIKIIGTRMYVNPSYLLKD